MGLWSKGMGGLNRLDTQTCRFSIRLIEDDMDSV